MAINLFGKLTETTEKRADIRLTKIESKQLSGLTPTRGEMNKRNKCPKSEINLIKHSFIHTSASHIHTK